jgi:outer membrane protein W
MLHVSLLFSDDSTPISIGYGSLTPTPTNPNWQPPSALTIKLKPQSSSDFKPYIGTGLAYRIPTQDIPHVANKEINAGLAGSAGFSYLVGKNSSLNLDYNYLYIAPDAKFVHEGKTPQLLGIGLDLKF